LRRADKKRNLTPKQLRFVSGYVEGGNKVEAYRQAYDCRRMTDATIRRKSQEVATSPTVAAEIERHYTDLRECNKLTGQRVMEEIGALAFSDFTDYVQVAAGRYQVRDLDDLTKEQRTAIKSIRSVQTPDGPRIEIELHDKMGALRQLAKSLGLNEKKPPTEAEQIHIHLDMRGDGPIDIYSDVVDVTPVPAAIEGDLSR
jgi:hypothetical protein